MSEYEQIGVGEHAVIALHGWFGSATAWRPVLPYLDRSRFHYVFPDLRGYGARISEPGEHTAAEVANDVLAVADELGFDWFSLIGHSMGGSFMQRVLAEAPDRIRSMVGISPVPASGIPFDEQTWTVFSGAATDAGNRRAIVDQTTGNRHTNVWIESIVRHSLENSDQQAFADYLTAWATTDFHSMIEGSPVPVKVIAGENDPAISESVLRSTFEQWYPECAVEVFSNAGHYAIDETPVALATSVETFLSKH